MIIFHSIFNRFLDRLVWPTPQKGDLSGPGDCLFSCCCRFARPIAGSLAVPFFLLGYGLLFWSTDSLALDVPRTEIVGRVYPIIETDALEEIEAKVASRPFDPKVFGEEEDWSALKSPALPLAPSANTRDVIPFFSLSFDIPDKDGNILYPKGYTFNPLEYMTLPQRLIVVNGEQLEWAFGQAETGDMVLLSGGNALEATRQAGKPVFKLEKQVRDRLDLKYVPSIVRQEGSKLIIDEYDLTKEKADG